MGKTTVIRYNSLMWKSCSLRWRDISESTSFTSSKCDWRIQQRPSNDQGRDREIASRMERTWATHVVKSCPSIWSWTDIIHCWKWLGPGNDKSPTWCDYCSILSTPKIRSAATSYGVIVFGKIRIPAINDEKGEGFVHVRYVELSGVPLWYWLIL